MAAATMGSSTFVHELVGTGLLLAEKTTADGRTCTVAETHFWRTQEEKPIGAGRAQ
jgi:hypothetical protein